eukprot:TRINITY_DN80479_c0_g1_i1.p1 TRINITY_DN80479_c0_g1~~TRINITY_DN80479_c0_g1_i1.p1  ORF type:complete len:553 (-),score=71.90 TRINITY_DN80479_c0_g1_i1:43-1701(-)
MLRFARTVTSSLLQRLRPWLVLTLLRHVASASLAVERLGAGATQAVREMLQWLEEGGSTWAEDLQIREIIPGERGLVTLVDRGATEENLLVVPYGRTLSHLNCLHNETSFVNRLSAKMREQFSKSHALLHICYLEHSLLLKDASEFAPFLRAMPESLGHLPLLTTLNLTALLEGSPLLIDINKHRRDLEDRYNQIVWELPEFGRLVTVDEFMYTYCSVESHSHARHDHDETIPLMVPLVDLVNHRSKSPTLRLGKLSEPGKAEEVAVHMNHGAAAGEQLFFKYSDIDEPSSKILKQFGFIDQELQIASKVAFPLQSQHPRYSEKRMLFDENLIRTKLMVERTFTGSDLEEYLRDNPGALDFPLYFLFTCGPAGEGFPARRPQSIKEELLPFARFVVLDADVESLKQLGCDTSKKPPACLKVLEDAQKEEMAFKYLVKTVFTHLQRYPGPPEIDDSLLDTLPLGAVERPYIRLRRDEKRCLLRLLQEVQLTAKNQHIDISTEMTWESKEEPLVPDRETGMPALLPAFCVGTAVLVVVLLSSLLRRRRGLQHED